MDITSFRMFNRISGAYSASRAFLHLCQGISMFLSSLSSYKQLVNLFIQCQSSLVNPWKWLVNPWKGLLQPWKRLVNPWKWLLHPWKWLVNPWKWLVNPWTVVTLWHHSWSYGSAWWQDAALALDEPAFGDLHGAMLGNLDKAAALFEIIDKKGIKAWLYSYTGEWLVVV